MTDEQRVKEVWPQVLKHGRDCPKVEHLGAGYLHEADDDGPYDVDGIAYCGRCHGWLGADAASRLPEGEVAICPKCHKPHYNMEDTAMCAAAVLIKEEAMPINKFRKKPVVIEAWDAHQLLIFAAGSWKDLPVQIRDAYERGDVIFARDHIVIKTLEGDHRAEPSDKVICGVRGELYPCKPDIFAATYEPETK